MHKNQFGMVVVRFGRSNSIWILRYDTEFSGSSNHSVDKFINWILEDWVIQ